MDKRFNGLRFSSTRGCLIDEGGEEFRLRESSTQVFLLLKRNLNELVTKEQLLSKVPDKPKEHRPDFAPVSTVRTPISAPTSAPIGSTSSDCDDSLNDCIAEIKHVVGDNRLKTIPRVGYLLTSDAAGESLKLSSSGLAMPHGRKRSTAALLQELAFNSQWFVCTYQKSPFAWTGALLLIAVILFSLAGTSDNAASGHVAFDRADSINCTNQSAECATCALGFWQTSTEPVHSNWFLSMGCKNAD